MIRCSICPNILSTGKLCLSCGRAYCDNHEENLCTLCGGILVNLTTKTEDINGLTVEWLLIGANKIGLVGFDSIPIFISGAIRSDQRAFDLRGFKIVVFPSKKLSDDAMNRIRKKFGENEDIIPPMIPSPEASRYSVIVNFHTEERLVLFNAGAISDADMKLLLIYVPKLLYHLFRLRLKNDKLIATTLLRVLLNYNKKFPIPFAIPDEGLTKIAIDNTKGSYAEYLALRELIGKVDPTKAADFIETKIDTIFSGIQGEMVFFSDVYNLFGSINLALACVASAYISKPVSQSVSACFERKIRYCKAQLSGYQDIIKALDVYVAGFSSPESYANYDGYLDAQAKSLSKALENLQPSYFHMEEQLELGNLSIGLAKEFSEGKLIKHPKVGSVFDLLELFSKIFHNAEAYPEIRILARMLSNFVNLELLKSSRNHTLYNKAANFILDFSAQAEEIISYVKSRSHLLPQWYTRYLLKYADEAEQLLAMARLAEYLYEDKDTAEKLYRKSEDMARRLNNKEMEITILWNRFLSTHDYECPKAIHRIMPDLDSEIIDPLKSYVKIIKDLVVAIVEEKNRSINLVTAGKEAIEIPAGDLSDSLPIDFLSSVRGSSAFYFLVKIFEHVLLAEVSDLENNIRQANSFSNALIDTIDSKSDPLATFAYKTKILHDIVTDSRFSINESLQSIKPLISKGSSAELFIDNVARWKSFSQEASGNKFLGSFDFRLDNNDPWSRLLKNYEENEIEKDFKLSIAGAEAIVFVEGSTDERILKEFSKKIYPERGIIFVDSEGFTNAPGYPDAKISKLLQKSLFVVFDGDTDTVPEKKRRKDALLSRISLPESNIITLKKNSIEDYMLIPRAIKQAFPNISFSKDDIKRLLNEIAKRNKKEVLDIILKRGSVGKYDYDKAAAIASAMAISEIDSEIIRLFELFVGKA